MAGNNRIVLQDRDVHLLTEFEVTRIMDRELAKCVGAFGSTTRANTRLLALVRAGLLRRFFIGAAGAARKALYALSRKGALVAHVPYRGMHLRNDEVLIADFAVTHQLWINEIYCLLKYRRIPVPGAQCSRWFCFHEPIAAEIPLIPDGYAEVMTPEKTLAMFFEIDLGHENQKVWHRKIATYFDYAVSGKFQSQFSQSQFRVLVIANSERRLASLRKTTATLTEKIFWFATLDAIKHDGFWSPIWQRPKDDQQQSLF